MSNKILYTYACFILSNAGLDPATIMFPKDPKSRGLDSADAQNVDVLHTSYLGYTSNLGHADFYINGGKIQPGCNAADGLITNNFVSS